MGLFSTRLVMMAGGPGGSVECRVQRPLLSADQLLPTALVAGGFALLARNQGLVWELAAPLATVAAVMVLLLQSTLEVSTESLVYTPGEGVRLLAARRAGPRIPERTIPLHRISRIAIEQNVHARGKPFVLALVLHDAPTATTNTAAEEDDLVQAELVFPNTMPRLPLLRQVFAEVELQLTADVAGGKKGTGRKAGRQGGSGQIATEVKKER